MLNTKKYLFLHVHTNTRIPICVTNWLWGSKYHPHSSMPHTSLGIIKCSRYHTIQSVNRPGVQNNLYRKSSNTSFEFLLLF